MATNAIDLEGNELQIIRIGRADTAESTVLHVPSLGAVVIGDLAYNEVHMMTAETGEREREHWIANLDTVAALEPSIVVAGHKKVTQRQRSEDHRRIPTVFAGLLGGRERRDHGGWRRRSYG